MGREKDAGCRLCRREGNKLYLKDRNATLINAHSGIRMQFLSMIVKKIELNLQIINK